MKKLLLATFILACTSMVAQPPMGGGGRGQRPEGGPRGGRPPMQRNADTEGQNLMIIGLPEISGLTLEQQEKLSKEITNERKDISKLMQKKNEIRIDSENPGISEKQRQKLSEKIVKVDEDIKKKEAKYDKKYRSILSEEQYKVFAEKKKDIKFTGQRPSGNRPQRGDFEGRPENGPGNEMMPPAPDGDMF